MLLKTTIVVALGSIACSYSGLLTPAWADGPERAWHDSDAWRAHWHAGDAEVARYALSFSRYGEAREGEAVLVFVTEELHPKTHVKNERKPGAEVGAVPVLKLNRLQRFETGVYDYSMMLSVFTPENVRINPRSLKFSASSQEWCGQVWLQGRLDGEQYRCDGHSYFEAEADERFVVRGALLEDEVFNRIRIDPASLPTGEALVVPGSFDSRLRHYKPVAQKARCRLLDGETAATRRYEIAYESGRTLRVDFDRALPHGILGWRESFSRGASLQTTSAKRTHVRRVPYWRHKRVRDRGMRDTLGLTPHGR